MRSGRELSPALARLYASLPALSANDRRQAEALLARPDDGQPDPDGTHKWTGPEAPGSPKCTTHFCVHFTLIGSDASNATYAQAMANLFENEVYPCENGVAAAACAGSPGLGWRDPAGDGARGGNNAVDVYIEDLYANERVFGYVALDPDQPQDPSIPHFGYMVMDKDYTRFGNGTAAAGVAAESVTAAHEYNHVLQNAYDYLEDPWLFEATAVYMEDKVYPSNNDYLNYVSAWTANSRQPLTTFASTNLKAYGSAVWNHWLDHRFGAVAVRGTWERSVAAGDFAPAAYSAGIAAAGGSDFSDEFGRFAAAVAEWNAPGSGFPDRYPDLPRDGLLPSGSQTAPFALAHTTFAFFDVPIPASAPPVIRLMGALPTGTAGALALVARTGGDPASGAVTTNLTEMPHGGTAVATLQNPAQYGRITAVVANADVSRLGFDAQADDWAFSKDAADVVVSLNEPGPPAAVTGAADLISDHAAVAKASVDPHLLDTSWSIEYGRSAGYGAKTPPQPLPAATVGAASGAAPLPDLKANTTYHYRVVASNAAGAATGADLTFRTARDVTKPVVAFKVKPQRIRTARTRGLVYLGRCSERCTGSAELTVSRALARRLGTGTLLAKRRIVLDARTSSSTLRVRLTRRAKKQLASLTKSFDATLRIRVADESRNAVSLQRRVTLKR